VKSEYFSTVGIRSWDFTGDTVARNGQMIQHHQFLASSVPIKRHIKVRSTANPDGPAWEPYFERRLGVQLEATLAGRQKLLLSGSDKTGTAPAAASRTPASPAGTATL
jgi:RNA-directed DNA polymerase